MDPVIIEFIGGGVLPEQGNLGGPVYGEDWLLRALPYPALEAYRRVLLDRVAVDPTKFAANRIVVQFIYQSEIKMVFADILGPRPDLERRALGQAKALAVDAATHPLRDLRSAALSELKLLGVPQQHLDLLDTHSASPSFVHRVSALCAMVFLGAILHWEAVGSDE